MLHSDRASQREALDQALRRFDEALARYLVYEQASQEENARLASASMQRVALMEIHGDSVLNASKDIATRRAAGSPAPAARRWLLRLVILIVTAAVSIGMFLQFRPR